MWLLVRGCPRQQLAPATQPESYPQSGGPRLPNCSLSFLPVPLCVPQEIPQELTLDALLEMDEAKAKEMLRRWGASVEECSRLQQALTCLRKVTGLGKQCLLCPRAPFCLCSQAWLVPLGDGTSARVGLGIDRGGVLQDLGGSFGVAV